MDNKSIAEILRDFGDDYAGAAQWARRELTDAKNDQFLADKMTYHELFMAQEQQLTAAEEQLAEMRDIVEIVAAVDEPLPDALEDKTPIFQGITAGLVRQARQALSAAPKRGRVLWEGNGRIREEAGYHEDEQSSYHYTAYYVEPLKITDFDSFLVGTDLDAKCKWLYNDLPVTVTVREAE